MKLLTIALILFLSSCSTQKGIVCKVMLIKPVRAGGVTVSVKHLRTGHIYTAQLDSFKGKVGDKIRLLRIPSVTDTTHSTFRPW